MIEYVEIRNADRETIGIIDTAKSIIWTSRYYGVGDFEIYTQATAEALEMLKIGNYVTRPDDKNVGIIETLTVNFNAQDGYMITAAGSFAKSILSRRLIYNLSGNTVFPVVISGNVETAVRGLVSLSIISAADAARNVSFIELGPAAGLEKTIVDASGSATQKQTSYSNLREYTDEVLQEYELSAYMGIDRETLKLQYIVFAGVDRSGENTAGNTPIVFSQEFDSLLASDYTYDTAALKNTALIGGEGEGTARFYALLTPADVSGMERREVFVDGADQPRKYEDSSGTEAEYTETEYAALLKSKARQELLNYIVVETFAGEVDITNSGLVYGQSFGVGDLVTIQDNKINKYATTRIVSVTEVQDDNGYQISVEFGG